MLTTINIHAMNLRCFIGCKSTDFQGNIKIKMSLKTIVIQSEAKNLEDIKWMLPRFFTPLRYVLNDN